MQSSLKEVLHFLPIMKDEGHFALKKVDSIGYTVTMPTVAILGYELHYSDCD